MHFFEFNKQTCFLNFETKVVGTFWRLNWMIKLKKKIREKKAIELTFVQISTNRVANTLSKCRAGQNVRTWQSNGSCSNWRKLLNWWIKNILGNFFFDVPVVVLKLFSFSRNLCVQKFHIFWGSLLPSSTCAL